jgi:2'-5' RNA ligase
MQKFTQKYAIIQLFEDVPEGTQFFWKEWPLHSTVADVFAIDWDEAAMTERLTKLLSSHAPATSVAEDDRLFGDQGQTQVTLLKRTDDLLKLHHDVIECLEHGGWKPNDPQFAHDGFLPHSTVQKHARLNKGDEVAFNTLTIIDMLPGGDPYQRKAITTIKLAPPSISLSLLK